MPLNQASRMPHCESSSFAAAPPPSRPFLFEKHSRRTMLGLTGRAALLLAAGIPGCSLRRSAHPVGQGAIIGEEAGAQVGLRMLSAGGNAIDAVVAAALTSCVATPSRCGIGGYGGHMTLALADGKTITSIDFNS